MITIFKYPKGYLNSYNMYVFVSSHLVPSEKE